ncbi:ABC transporter ATP-binding protein [Mesorhizobium australicum]|uniref:Branched-chain amino acid transport system ATP-binding protein n=1 Tax=Mesorhizobium australicum TaxID=536018 RepID=A0A1X7NHJ0_9HYPH|nr:ABC transporter ATP-binding protein [Mesorhizobium australicum]SMH36559.1 branched-chain amino acid transport system ATP-binding protein [Mesorhizobium australicum]
MSSSQTAANLIEVRGLRRSFAGVHAVDGLDLDVAQGSVTGLIGPNGCGKTTSVNCITGFDRGFTGQVDMEGKPLAGLAPDAIARGGLMRTFQAIRVFDTFTVLENVKLAMQSFDGVSTLQALARTPKLRRTEEETEAKAHELLALVGLSAKSNDAAGELSYGQKKLLSLAGILMSGPRLVILDEPVAGVNPTRAMEIADIIKTVNARGTTFLIIEHNIPFVMRLCDSVVVMDRGKRLVQDTPDAIRNDPAVLEAYLGGAANVGD